MGVYFVKLKIKNLNKLIDELSGREIDFFLYLVKRQCSMGCVNGVYYRDVLEDLHMPRSTFYVALDTLEKKGFVRVDWFNSRKDFNIVVIDNSFLSEDDFKEGYVNVNLDFILSEQFILLNVNLKKFFLRMLGLQANTKSVKLLKDTLRQYKVHGYLEELAKLFNMILDGNGYLFTIKSELLKKSNNDEYLQYEHKLVGYCKNYNINYSLKELRDSVKTIINNRKTRMAHVLNALDSIRKKGILQPKLITSYCYNRY